MQAIAAPPHSWIRSRANPFGGPGPRGRRAHSSPYRPPPAEVEDLRHREWRMVCRLRKLQPQKQPRTARSPAGRREMVMRVVRPQGWGRNAPTLPRIWPSTQRGPAAGNAGHEGTSLPAMRSDCSTSRRSPQKPILRRPLRLWHADIHRCLSHHRVIAFSRPRCSAIHQAGPQSRSSPAHRPGRRTCRNALSKVVGKRLQDAAVQGFVGIPAACLVLVPA